MNKRAGQVDPGPVDLALSKLGGAEKPLSVPEQIAVHLAREILNGEIEEGSKLSEYQLADRFGVSRGPIRDAIGILERNCLVRSSPRLSARVNSVARSEVEQLFAVRSEVLALMGKYAARNITEEEIAQFRAAVDGLEQQFAAEPEDVVRFYLASHRCWTVVARASKARTINHINSMITSSPIWQIAVRDRLGEQGMRSTGEGLIANWNGFYDSVVARDETAASDRARTITMVTWKLIRDTFGDDQP